MGSGIVRTRAGRLTLAALTFAATASAQAPRPAFEVASVKRQESPQFGPPASRPPNVYYRSGDTVEELVRFGWGVQRFQVLGGPPWAGEDRFEINARAAEPVPRELMWPMVQALLEDRFGLVVRHDRQEMDVAAIVLSESDGRTGPQLLPCTDPGNPPPVRPIRVPPGGWADRKACVPLARLAELATGFLGHPVVDGTGLDGYWDYEIAFAYGDPPTSERVRELAERENLPQLPIALEEQLGLRLEPGRRPVDVLVIESVEQPSEN
jgi:uncharacterized protein (TIGR03435 family)